MNITSLSRCRPCSYDCDTLEQFLLHTQHHLDIESNTSSDITPSDIRTQVLLQAVLTVPPMRTAAKLPVVPLSRNKGRKSEEICNIPYGFVRTEPLHGNGFLSWENTQRKVIDPDADLGLTKIPFLKQEFSIKIDLPPKFALRLGQNYPITDKKLCSAKCILTKLTPEQLMQYGYELKGSKFVITKEKIEEESRESKPGGRPCTKRRAKKCYPDPSEPKRKRPSASNTQSSAPPKYKSSRLFRGEEFTLFQGAHDDAISDLHRFCQPGDEIPDAIGMIEESPEICDPWKESFDTKENELPVPFERMIDILAKHCPKPIVKQDDERALTKSRTVFSLASIIPTSAIEDEDLRKESEEIPCSRGRPNLIGPKPSGQRKSPSKMYKCEYCTFKGNKRTVLDHCDLSHPDQTVHLNPLPAVRP